MDNMNRTWTDVVNKALAALGRDLLPDLEQEGGDAQLAALMVPEAVSVCAGYYDWTFLRKVQRLTPDETPTGPFGYSFTLPSNAMRTVRIDTEGEDFFIMENKVCTSSPICTVTYQELPEGIVPSAPAWNAALVHYLTYLMAKSLTGNDNLVQQEYQLFMQWIDKARKDDRSWLPKGGAKWWGETDA